MTTILVSGASGIVGYGILRSLRKSQKHLKLIGSSIYTDSAAPGFCDHFELAPKTTDEKYLPWLIDTIKKHQIDLIIPGIEIDLYTWTENREQLLESGTKILINNPALIELCKDKWNFYQALMDASLPCIIPSSLTTDFATLKLNFGLPFLLKPRRGFGARGIVIVHDEAGFTAHQHLLGDVLMAQPIMGHDQAEFTTSAFCDGRGAYSAHMTLKRMLSREGYTDKAEVVPANQAIETALKQLCSIFKPAGPTNFQFRKHDGIFKLLEINPRISSSTSIRAAFGYNEALMAVDYYLNGTLPAQPVITQGKAVRYVEDMIFMTEHAQ